MKKIKSAPVLEKDAFAYTPTPDEPLLTEPAYQEDDQFIITDATHTHQWVLTTKTYAPPRRQLIQGLEGDLLEHALFGVTTILSECLVCKESKKETAVGSETSQLDELTDKTELYGPQYFQRDNITYILQRYIPANTSTQTVPLR